MTDESLIAKIRLRCESILPQMMNKVTVHYYRFDGDYAGWNIWSWDGHSHSYSHELNPIGQDSEGLIFQFYPHEYGLGDWVGLLPRKGQWEIKDDPDRYWKPEWGDDIWLIESRPDIMKTPPETTPSLRLAYLDDALTVRVLLWNSIHKNQLTPFVFSLLDEHGKRYSLHSANLWPEDSITSRTVLLRLEHPLGPQDILEKKYKVERLGYKSVALIPGHILDHPPFISNQPLGALYSPNNTIFRIFLPTAESVTLCLYQQPVGGKSRDIPLQRNNDGTWQETVIGDCKNKFYTYRVKGFDPRFNPQLELIDPYAHCTTAHDGRAIIVDDRTVIAERPKFDISQAVIYELHIRDYTIDPRSGIKHKGKYLGVAEFGTMAQGLVGVSTGIDHLIDLGVNTVQLMPFQEFENDDNKDDYNWGYMPVHYNSPEGWYSLEPHSSRRVSEVKTLIDALHKRGIKVIMDVVYNHTAENETSRIFSFNGLVPGYYYRIREDGSYWNGSGCGNEFRTEAPMVRRFILDSLKYWATEYKVDGFRFDLMGLIDQETIDMIIHELKMIEPDIFIYGEPWAAGSSAISVTVKGSQKSKGYSVFNDHYRNALKGNPFGWEAGYIIDGAHRDAVKQGIMGGVFDFTEHPVESINYVECHDNQTLWDRINWVTRDDNRIHYEDRVLMDKLAAVLIMVSQGVPFIQAGQEFLRTKGGVGNSYNHPDSVNMIRWQDKLRFNEIYRYYRGLIHLRKAHPMFRLKTRDEVLNQLHFLDDHYHLEISVPCIGFHLIRGNTGDPWKEIIVYINPDQNRHSVPLLPGQWKICVNSKEAVNGLVHHGHSIIHSSSFEIPPRSAIIAFKD